MDEEKAFVSSDTHIITAEGKEIPISVSTSLLKDSGGETSWAGWRCSEIIPWWKP